MSSPRTLISADEALELVLDAAAILPTERRSIQESFRLVLAEPVCADRDQPPFDRAMMDGYAVPEGADGQRLPIVDQVAAGFAAETPLTKGECAEILTGASCPAGTWAVVPKEHIQLEANEVLFPDHIEPQQYIAPRGSERRQGETILETGDRIDALAIAVLASVGKQSALVIRPAKTAIVTTGAEVVSSHTTPEGAQIRDANGPMLCAMARRVGVEHLTLQHAPDQMVAIAECVEQLADFDVLVLTGGVSAGQFDFVPDALRQAGAEIVFHKVLQKPGKPLLFARRNNQLIFGLPGHPLACHFSFHRYVASAIRKMQGQDARRPVLTGELTEAVERRTDRKAFILGKVDEALEPARPPRVHPLPGRSSADVFRAVLPNCYLEIPTGDDKIPAGGWIRYTRLDEI